MYLLPILFLVSLAFANEPGEINANDFFRHPNGSKSYSESWDYVFVLDNGAKAYVTYTWLNSSGEVGTQFSIWNFRNKSANVGRIYPKERYREDKTTNVISIKDEYKMENLPGKDHRVLFTADKNGKFFLDLKFTSAQAGKAPGDGVFNVDGQKYGLYVHIPYGRVEGRIGINEDTVAIKGYGYMDHSWTSTEATSIVARSLAFSTTTMEKNVSKIAGRVNVSPKGTVFGYAVPVIEGTLAEPVVPVQILDNGSNYSPKKFPGNMEIKWNGEEVPPLSFAVAHQERFPLLVNLGLPKIVISAKGGEIYHLRGRSKTDSWGRVDWSLSGK
ncbi:MAG: carotenoid 1,2-hydratase [Fibromonadales bacterium]|nr:carotenoid 1,2-hydratase [Fibromonadales bacterium]